MKRVFILPIALLACMNFSCKKCQKCTTETTQNSGGWEQTTSTTDKYCDDDVPQEGTYEQNYGGTYQQVVITCED